MTGVLAFLATAGAGCRSQIRRQCDQCSPYIVAAAPALTNARSVEYAQQYTAVLSTTRSDGSVSQGDFRYPR